MSDLCEITSIDENSSLYEILKNCAKFQSYDSLPIEDLNDVYLTTEYASGDISIENCPDMLSTNQYSVSDNISSYSFSEDALCGNILEENGRISLAYENLRTIPRRIAKKFAMQTKFLDLSYNNFQNLLFLSYFEDLHTLILDHNTALDVNTLPSLPNLKILWINNCDIANIVEWIQRINIKCPNLEYLSVMGNVAIKESFNVTNLGSAMVGTNTVGDYREFILKMLPNLQYLDGVHRDNLPRLLQSELNLSSTSTSPFPSDSFRNGTSSQSQQTNGSSWRKISSALSFKDLFKRRKKSYPSSSTN